MITMRHTNRDGSAKLVKKCTLPITAIGAVSMIITDLAVFELEAGTLILKELMPGATLEQVRENTEATFTEALALESSINGEYS